MTPSSAVVRAGPPCGGPTGYGYRVRTGRATGWDAVSPLEPSGIRSIRIVQPAGVLEVEYRITIPLINA
jgi:hypothetical protein